MQLSSIAPIRSLAELKGKKIIAWDTTGREILLKLGANPIRLTPADTYLSLSKGMADGVLAPFAAIRANKTSEVTPHHLILDLGITSFSLAMYKPLWEEFPPHVQEYFIKEGGINFGMKVGKSLEDGAKRDMEWMIGNGHQVYQITEAEQAELATLLAPSKDEWLASMPADKKELARKILAYAEERSAHYQKEFLKGVYGDYTLKFGK